MQGIYWLLTIPYDKWAVPQVLHDEIRYLKGQQEIGEGGYHHWQVLCIMKKKARINHVKTLFCNEAHLELTRSEAANKYVFKEDTRVPDSQFELGIYPLIN